MFPHDPFPKSYGNLKSMNKPTLNEPAIKIHLCFLHLIHWSESQLVANFKLLTPT